MRWSIVTMVRVPLALVLLGGSFATLCANQAVAQDEQSAVTLEELGRHLFFDERLSGDSSLSCASCHVPEAGWAFPQDLSKGYPRTANWRNSPTVVNSRFLKRLFWDGRADALEAQAEMAMSSPIEGNGHRAVSLARLAHIPAYVEAFESLFGVERPHYEGIWQAIAAFERTLMDVGSPYDAFLRGSVESLSDGAARGWRLFVGKAGCVDCHNGPMLTDEQFHVTGVPGAAQLPADGPLQVTFRFQIVGARGYRDDQLLEDPGRYLVTGEEADRGAFRTAPLRHTRYTLPYMHNGRFWSFEEVVDFYDAGGGAGSELAPLGLSAQEKGDLVSFLDSLSGPPVEVDRPTRFPYEDQAAGRLAAH